MQSQFYEKFPHPSYGIQFWGVWREIINKQLIFETVYQYHLSSCLQKFFKSLLLFRITLWYEWHGFPFSELQTVKDHLAGPHTYFHIEFQGDLVIEKLSIQQILFISEFHWILSRITINIRLCWCVSIEDLPDSFPSLMVIKPLPLNFLSHLSGYVSRIVAYHSSTNKKKTTQLLIVPWFLRTCYFIPYCYGNFFCFEDFKSSHNCIIIWIFKAILQKLLRHVYLKIQSGVKMTTRETQDQELLYVIDVFCW